MMRSLRMMTDNSEDPRYSEEKLYLRASCFRALVNNLQEQSRKVFEFATIWCEKNDTINGIEQGFHEYLRSYAEKAYGKS